ncbi:MAG: hypothetical protein BWY15_00429 [Firmicutes bacterium ADurb.Bin193]|nr:MAG: hypothetical protein BWY15_00429 [Firmicutes bacterium ADurb.Bin193]
MFGNVGIERKAIETTYEGSASITEYEEYTVESGATRHRELVRDGIPCALSQKSGKAADRRDDRSVIEYDAKLFVAPEHIIKPGSKITILQNGMNLTFVSVGEPFLYPTHQEVILKRKDNA